MNKNIEVIKQLLALARNTPYPEEAKTAQERAEKLMVKHGIEQATLESVGEVKTEYIKKTFCINGVYASAIYRGLANSIQSFRTVSIIADVPSQTHVVLYIMGELSDVNLMMNLCDSLVQQAHYARKHWWKTVKQSYMFDTPYIKTKVQKSFLMYFFKGVESRVTDMMSKTMKETDSKALVDNRLSKAVQYRDTQFPNTKLSRSRASYYTDGSDGYNKGYNANMSGASVTERTVKELV